VSVLELYSANHLVHWKPPETFTGGPIRHSQSSVVAGYQATRNDEQKSQNGDENGKTMMGGVVAGGGQNSSLKLIILSSWCDWTAAETGGRNW
jgi:hypothetical protein